MYNAWLPAAETGAVAALVIVMFTNFASSAVNYG